MKEFSELVGKVITAIDQSDKDLLRITLADGTVCELYHEQDCCEHVTIDEIKGTLADLIGEPLTVATEESVKGENPPGFEPKKYQDSWTWTTYTLATAKHSVSIRWYGESNGYYSEDVNFRVAQPQAV
jgi:hypothetical protein